MQKLVFLIVLAVLSNPILAAQRIVIAGGSLTDIVFALGGGKDVVAVDTSSTSPLQATQLPKVGYYRDLAAEGVLSQHPELILALQGSGRPEVLTQLRSTGVTLNLYDKPTNINELFNLIGQLGRDLNRQSQAQGLIARLKQTLPAKAPPSSLSALFILSAGDRGVTVAGPETVPDLLFGYTGIRNLATAPGYKPFNREAMLVSAPDFLVAPSHVVYSLGGPEQFCQQSALALLPAAQQCRLLVMDSLLSMGMTSRLPEAIAQLAAYREQSAL
ncbi:ABC transporter substrate-binding protein [Pseudoalteromonas sp. OOF1S-7]|uniref:heme/hemin ABC transporter substrate-binding protein n=1 Tax=Pseudoalteromonas sp. OOF1S-7 TaxID=2917757 RepID=UPI001EF744EF|nr:ABC transporter substrate-binding protein [Pseudoalteromonas sp. OOF1S-7]MCG7533779.1 ABC transporter substrate-binding protein [Pseudoalteromonas sp. OOF1S-7]